MNRSDLSSTHITAPEYVDNRGAFELFNLRRGLLYKLENEGVIRGVSLRRGGKGKGKRLWNVKTLRAFIEAHYVGNGK
jgi:hypothetical protein